MLLRVVLLLFVSTFVCDSRISGKVIDKEEGITSLSTEQLQKLEDEIADISDSLNSLNELKEDNEDKDAEDPVESREKKKIGRGTNWNIGLDKFEMEGVRKRDTTPFTINVDEKLSDSDARSDQSMFGVNTNFRPGPDQEEEDSLDIIGRSNEVADATRFTTDVDVMPDPTAFYDESGEVKRNAIHEARKLWADRIVPYEYDTENGTIIAEYVKPNILAAMETISNASCITFRPKTNEDTGTYLRLTKNIGCWSYVGKVMPRAQNLSIGAGCNHKGVIMHELMHALGFYHEQSRYDRDKYVRINWENVKKGKEGSFKKKTRLNSHNMGTDYDYEGLMHYGRYYFSRNGKPTISVVNRAGINKRIGGAKGLTAIDVEQLNTLYDCAGANQLPGKWSTWTSYSPCDIPVGSPKDRSCLKKRLRFCPIGPCDGSPQEIEKCSDDECKRDGSWSHWGEYGNCYAYIACTSGKKRRSRKCDSPAPLKGGKDCRGTNKESAVCMAHCPTRCTLNEDMCGYTTVGNWKHISGTTPSCSTGPNDDVTGGGKYVYTEASGFTNSTFVMTSPTFNATGGCYNYSFYYHMKGSTMGTLKVELMEPGSKSLLFQVSRNQGNKWFRKELHLAPTKDFKIVFRARSGWAYRSDMAIDQMVLTPSQCISTTTIAPEPVTTIAPEPITTIAPEPVTTIAPEPVTTIAPEPVTTIAPKPVTTIAPEPVTTIAPEPATKLPTKPSAAPSATTVAPKSRGDAVKFACNFEDRRDGNNLCGMRALAGGPGWKRRSFKSWTPKMYKFGGPGGDRSCERGYYLSVECNSRRDEGKVSEIRTDAFKSGGVKQTLEFYLSMYYEDKSSSDSMSNDDKSSSDGMASNDDAFADVGSFEVYLFTMRNRVKPTRTSVFKTSGNLGSGWHQIEIDIAVPAGDNFYLKFVATMGKRYMSTIAIDNIYFYSTLRRGSSLPAPTIMDCPFYHDAGFCSWTNDGDFPFTKKFSETPTLRTGPDTATTSHAFDGYIYIESSGPRKPGQVASLVSPMMMSSETSWLHFYSNMYGNNVGRLLVHIMIHHTDGKVSTNTKEIYGPNADVWIEQNVQLPVAKKFTVVIDATVGDGGKGDIAIDNIHVDSKCPQLRDTPNWKPACDVQRSTCKIRSVEGFKVLRSNKFVTSTLGNRSNLKLQMKLPVVFVAPQGGCLRFRYMMVGKSSGTFHLSLYYYKQYYRGGVLKRDETYGKFLGTIRDKPERSTMTAQINLPAGAGRQNYRVRFQATLRRSSMTGLNIGGFQLADGPCPTRS